LFKIAGVCLFLSGILLALATGPGIEIQPIPVLPWRVLVVLRVLIVEKNLY
jgi:hypothetical protein